MFRSGPFLSTTILILAAVLILAGCSDDSTEPSPGLTLEELWPHEDGMAWTYDLVNRKCGEFYPDGSFPAEDDVPPIPSPEELHDMLDTSPNCEERTNSWGTVNMMFDGEVVISPELTAQRLDSYVVNEEGWPSPPMGMNPEIWNMASDRIEGYQQQKADYRPSWVYLTSDLDPGSEFTFDMSWSVFNPLILQGRIWREFSYSGPEGGRTPAVECFYHIDLGVSQLTDESGEPLGFVGSVIYGSVVYAKGVGPVSWREQYAMSVIDAPGSYEYVVTRHKVAELAE